ncbi:hypothetical protein [Prescottella equi]
MPDAYATVDAVEEQWQPLTAQEKARAGALLGMAAVLLRRNVPELADPDAETEAVARQVSIDMVIDALLSGAHRGKSSYSTTVGRIVDSATLLNPSATVVFTTEQRALFGLSDTPSPSWYFGDAPRTPGGGQW